MGENGLSASDVALLSGNNTANCWGDSSFLWIFALLILANGGFGFGGNGFANAIGYENLATSNEVQRGFDNQNSMANQREILAAVNAGTAQSVGAANQVYHDIVDYVGDKYSELDRDVLSLGAGIQQVIANQNDCCCSTKLLLTEVGNGINANIAQSRYDAAMNTAAINANTTAQTQKILDAIVGNRMADMQQQINDLQLQNQLASVVRYPNNTFYADPSPCFNTGCGCGNI